jgi:hypothetical protein
MTVTLLWKCNKLIVTQQALLRFYGNAIGCIGHATKETPNMSQYEHDSFKRLATCLGDWVQFSGGGGGLCHNHEIVYFS